MGRYTASDKACQSESGYVNQHVGNAQYLEDNSSALIILTQPDHRLYMARPCMGFYKSMARQNSGLDIYARLLVTECGTRRGLLTLLIRWSGVILDSISDSTVL